MQIEGFPLAVCSTYIKQHSCELSALQVLSELLTDSQAPVTGADSHSVSMYARSACHISSE